MEDHWPLLGVCGWMRACVCGCICDKREHHLNMPLCRAVPLKIYN